MFGDDERFSRTDRLIGRESRMRLRGKRVLIAGIGGVGGACALTLARCGLGGMTLIDGDIVTPSNLNRQWVALRSTLGLPKVLAASRMIQDIDPEIEVRAIHQNVTGGNALDFAGGHDLLIDAVDDIPAKIVLALAARDSRTPIVSSMGAGNRLDPTRFRVGDVFQTHTDPLARAMRKACREVGIGALTVVWSDERPLAVPPDENGGHAPASIATVPPAAGLTLAAYALAVLRGEES